MSDRKDLSGSANDVADGYRSGVLRHLEQKDWPDTWAKLLRELQGRCPGLSEIEYDEALNQAFFESR